MNNSDNVINAIDSFGNKFKDLTGLILGSLAKCAPNTYLALFYQTEAGMMELTQRIYSSFTVKNSQLFNDSSSNKGQPTNYLSFHDKFKIYSPIITIYNVPITPEESKDFVKLSKETAIAVSDSYYESVAVADVIKEDARGVFALYQFLTLNLAFDHPKFFSIMSSELAEDQNQIIITTKIRCPLDETDIVFTLDYEQAVKVLSEHA